MKKIMVLIFFLYSFQLHAACKCNCDPLDFRLCAGMYDIEHPCGSLCSSGAPSLATMVTTCPVKREINQFGIGVWVTTCDQ